MAACGLALTASLLALHCSKGGFEEKPPKVGHLIAYSRDGGVTLSWDEGKQALLEQSRAAAAPVLDYSANQWLAGGTPVAGPGVSLDDVEITSHMRTGSLKLGPAKKVLGMSCLGPRDSLVCFAAVCTLEGDTLKSYDLRVCEDKNRTTAGCRTYQVVGGTSTHCPAYFHGAFS